MSKTLTETGAEIAAALSFYAARLTGADNVM